MCVCLSKNHSVLTNNNCTWPTKFEKNQDQNLQIYYFCAIVSRIVLCKTRIREQILKIFCFSSVILRVWYQGCHYFCFRMKNSEIFIKFFTKLPGSVIDDTVHVNLWNFVFPSFNTFFSYFCKYFFTFSNSRQARALPYFQPVPLRPEVTQYSVNICLT